MTETSLNLEQFSFFSVNFPNFGAFRFEILKNQSGDPLVKKILKNRFLCLIPQKSRLEKCRLAVKSVFKNIDFWGSYGPKSTEK